MGEWNGDGVGEVTNHTHAAAAPSLTPSLKAQEKKGNIFTYFQLNRKWKSRCSCRGRERAAQGEEGRKRERKRERACHDYHAISVNPKGAGQRHDRLFPTCQARRTASAPFLSLFLSSLSCCRFVLRASLDWGPGELLMMPTG